MNFGELLKQILSKVDGAVGALIMGLDGIAIEQQVSEGTPKDGQLGVIAGNMVLVIKLINPEYFLLIALAHGGNIGRARFELKKAQMMLEEEFAF